MDFVSCAVIFFPFSFKNFPTNFSVKLRELDIFNSHDLLPFDLVVQSVDEL